MSSTASPRTRPAGRLALVGVPLLAAATVLASCGSDGDAGPTRDTVSLESTAFVVRPPVTTTTEPEIVVEDGVVEGSQDYVIQPGDYPYKLVEQFGVPLEDLVNFNGWGSADEFPPAGETIKIPPGGKPVEATPSAGSTATDDDTSSEAAGTIPEAGDNCGVSEYTIEDGDVPIKVAEKFDVTVEELNQANASTDGYGAFYVGLVILVPAKDDC
jgi:LysM repeat protein